MYRYRTVVFSLASEVLFGSGQVAQMPQAAPSFDTLPASDSHVHVEVMAMHEPEQSAGCSLGLLRFSNLN